MATGSAQILVYYDSTAVLFTTNTGLSLSATGMTRLLPSPRPQLVSEGWDPNNALQAQSWRNPLSLLGWSMGWEYPSSDQTVAQMHDMHGFRHPLESERPNMPHLHLQLQHSTTTGPKL